MLNRATGARRKPNGYWRRNARLIRRHHAGVMIRGGVIAAARGAIAGAVIEMPFALAEAAIDVKKLDVSIQEASKTSGKKIGTAAVAGGIGGVATYALMAATGTALIGPLAVIGGVTFIGAASTRSRSIYKKFRGQSE